VPGGLALVGASLVGASLVGPVGRRRLVTELPDVVCDHNPGRVGVHRSSSMFWSSLTVTIESRGKTPFTASEEIPILPA
jgi:hypothetical protein